LLPLPNLAITNDGEFGDSRSTQINADDAER